ncbi:S9 family peptidase [Aquisediminimonas profunda]|uniref:S9 family peptidase n=1 Tax=Aquisediminimonas profunda TaxID=1550733 RepID=UPI001C63550F|nr:DPP IV N-terminal domain-containing protein [Aquisediminimonas profunda]
MALSWEQRAHAAQASLFLGEAVSNGAVFPIWIDDHHFWYERSGDDGPEYAIVDAAAGQRQMTLTRRALAAALADLLDVPIDRHELVLSNMRFNLAESVLAFSAYGEAYAYDWLAQTLNAAEKTADRNWLPSPDGGHALLLAGDNLQLRDLATGAERSLTTDGTPEYAYAVPGAALRQLNRSHRVELPEAVWSPDGRWILTLQTDERHVLPLSLAEYAPGSGVRPVIHSNQTSLPEDPKVTEFRMIAIEVSTGRQIEARYPRLVAVRMNATVFGSGMAWWSADSRIAYFIDVERGEQKAHVVAFDVATGSTRIVFSEESATYVEVSVNVYTKALIAPLPATNELVWYSERSGRGHLYLYDLVTGALRCAITAGDWQVREVLRIDAGRREIFFLAAGIAPTESPYVTKPCVASLDGAMRVLAAAPGDHVVWRPGGMAMMLKTLEGMDGEAISGLSPSGDYFVETVSSVTELPRTWLRGRDGREILLLETAKGDLPEGWQDPEPVECLAADGLTKTYGLLFKPLGREDGARYPLIDLIYGGPQLHNVPHASFANGDIGSGTYIDAVHLASLGAYVLVLDGRGTANREQAFRTASYRAAHTASNLEDHIAAIHQLAQANGQIDLDRIGITGFSGGGYMTAHAALRFGDFFKVAVAGGGNYDQALFWHSWGERYHGAYDAEHYAAQAAKTYAEGLSGKLMLVHGMMDAGCHPAGLFQLVQSLIEADKDVDLVLLPRGGHDWQGYGLRRRWAYFVSHLFGETPPPLKSFDRPLEHTMKRFVASRAKPKKVEA